MMICISGLLTMMIIQHSGSTSPDKPLDRGMLNGILSILGPLAFKCAVDFPSSNQVLCLSIAYICHTVLNMAMLRRFCYNESAKSFSHVEEFSSGPDDDMNVET